METTTTLPEKKWLRSYLFRAAVLIAAVGICALAISAQSLWVNEVHTVDKALQPSPDAWWQEMAAAGGPDLQMPVYMAFMWGWNQVVSHGEWLLRAANLPWIALGLLAIPRRRLVFIGLIVFSPFLWFCMDDARPYAMEFGASLMMLGALWHLAEAGKASSAPSDGEGLRVAGFCLGLVVLAGSSLTGLIWAGAAMPIAAAVLGGAAARPLARRNWPVIAGTAVLWLALTAYDLWTLKAGMREPAGSAGIETALVAGGELLGFMGLGPGQMNWRVTRMAALLWIAIPVALYVLAFLAVGFAGCKRIVHDTPRRLWLGAGGVLGAVLTLLVAADALTHFRVLGLYVAPLAPPLVLVLTAGVVGFWKRGGWRRLVPILFAGLTVASAASTRLAHRHAKDDYQSAAAAARTAVSRGERVWWFADRMTASYYGVPISPPNEAAGDGQVWAVEAPTDQLLAGQRTPNLVILGRTDVFDSRGAVRGYLAKQQFIAVRHFPAFTLWRKEL
jgi:hypothetical protein